jgi:hypothetical protein
MIVEKLNGVPDQTSAGGCGRFLTLAVQVSLTGLADTERPGGGTIVSL